MNIQPTNSSLVKLNPYLTEDPQKTASSLRSKAFAINVLEKITWIAILAIVGAVLTISHLGIILTGYAPLLLVLTVLSTIPLSLGATKLRGYLREYAEKANRAEKIAIQFDEIKHWKEAEIKKFFEEQNLCFDHLPIDELKKINCEEPYSTLLPLIAFYRQLSNESLDYHKKSEENLSKSDESRVIRLSTRQIGWRQLEAFAIPRALDAAMVLQIIQQPTLTSSLSDISVYHVKSYEERMFDRTFEPKNDNFVVFNEDQNRQPITFKTLHENLAPKVLRLILFPQGNRV